jgi:hypothetical protein
MVLDGDMSVGALRYLLEARGECEHLDYKEKLPLDSDYNYACLGRDVVAMKNTGGGYLVAGVEDKTWQPLGLSESFSLDTKEYAVRKATGPDLDVDIVTHGLVHQRSAAFVRCNPCAFYSKATQTTITFTLYSQLPCKREMGDKVRRYYFRKGDSTVGRPLSPVF